MEIVLMAVLIAWMWREYRHEKERDDWMDRLQAKSPEDYEAVRLQREINSTPMIMNPFVRHREKVTKELERRDSANELWKLQREQRVSQGRPGAF